MLFSFKHTLFLTFGAFTLLQSAIAHPVLLLHDEDLIKRDGAYGSELSARSDIDAVLDGAAAPSYRPAPTRLRLGHEASTELDRLGLHGKSRKNTIKWHKKQLKKAMGTDPLLKNKAEGGVIEHIAHKGGSVPHEKNHITASFINKHGENIPNNFNDGIHHHIYVSGSNKGLPSHVKGAMHGANARINHKSRNHQVASGKTRTPGKSRGKGKGKNNRDRNFSKNSRKGHNKKGGK